MCETKTAVKILSKTNQIDEKSLPLYQAIADDFSSMGDKMKNLEKRVDSIDNKLDDVKQGLEDLKLTLEKKHSFTNNIKEIFSNKLFLIIFFVALALSAGIPLESIVENFIKLGG